MKQNWEQNVEIGSNMLHKPVHRTRIHMINWNGILLANNSLEFKMLCKAGMENSTDYMEYMETTLDTWCGHVTKLFYDNAWK
eukprot:9627438-Ditylum_brightwellii.AAC.1